MDCCPTYTVPMRHVQKGFAYFGTSFISAQRGIRIMYVYCEQIYTPEGRDNMNQNKTYL